MKVAPSTEGDKLLNERPEGFGFGVGGLDALVANQGRRHVGQHRLAMARRTVQLMFFLKVSHGKDPSHSVVGSEPSSQPVGERERQRNRSTAEGKNSVSQCQKSTLRAMT